MTCSSFLNPRAFLTGLLAPTLAISIMVSTGMGGVSGPTQQWKWLRLRAYPFSVPPDELGLCSLLEFIMSPSCQFCPSHPLPVKTGPQNMVGTWYPHTHGSCVGGLEYPTA